MDRDLDDHVTAKMRITGVVEVVGATDRDILELLLRYLSISPAAGEAWGTCLPRVETNSGSHVSTKSFLWERMNVGFHDDAQC